MLRRGSNKFILKYWSRNIFELLTETDTVSKGFIKELKKKEFIKKSKIN